MDFENANENFQVINEIEEQIETNDFPPKFEDDAENNEEFPPSFGTLGESVEHSAARHELETNIANGHEIAAENSLKKLAKIEAKEAIKKI